MYQSDSFFTLSVVGQIGLAAISVALFVLMCGAAHWGATRFSRLTTIIGVLVSYYVFVWLSPQIYYLYYLQVFDGLPWQIVVKTPPGLPDIFRLVTFSRAPNLSAHALGLLFWAMVVIALLRGWRQSIPSDQSPDMRRDH